MSPKGYTTRQIADLLGASPSRVRAYVKDGVVAADRDDAGALRFTFRDVVLLRVAEGLSRELPPVRVRRALRKLAEHLPEGRPMAGLRIFAEGREIIVRDGDVTFQAESGQGIFDFDAAAESVPVSESAPTEGSPSARVPVVMPFRLPPSAPESGGRKGASADEMFARGAFCESGEPERAITEYRAALDIDPKHANALINLGRMLHESGETREAADLYLRALETNPKDPTALFNLGVALQDLGRLNYARRCYEHALVMEPDNADAHYNAAKLCEQLGDKSAAMRHLMSYRALTHRA